MKNIEITKDVTLPTPKGRGSFDNWKPVTGKLVLINYKGLSDVAKENRRKIGEDEKEINSEIFMVVGVEGSTQRHNVMLSNYLDKVVSLGKPQTVKENGIEVVNFNFIGMFEGSNFSLTPLAVQSTETPKTQIKKKAA